MGNILHLSTQKFICYLQYTSIFSKVSVEQMVTLGYSWELLLHTNQGDTYYREKVLKEVEQDFSSYDKLFLCIIWLRQNLI